MSLVLAMTGCRMRYETGSSYKMSPKDGARRTHRHYGASKKIKPRKEIWGRKHYGPRPYRHRGRYRY
ncbi:hypothetical protein GCM10023093_13060 [Nemorincola caseinilytica]|uniref:Uncharacterized protein n=2 Tax=Nemorincola caseinilytica TaxID=2054315 RepID=A0ABP8NBV9_9BACT